MIRCRTLTGPPGTPLAAWLDSKRHFHGDYFRPLVAPASVIVAATEGAQQNARLPEGAARPEADAVLQQRLGMTLEWGESIAVSSVREVEAICRARGRSSVDIIRSDPSLVTELQVGSWFQAAWRGRLLRRGLLRIPVVARALRSMMPKPSAFEVATEVAFWSGVRQEATKEEWARLTRSSYVAFCYHRFAGEMRPGEEQLDVPPAQLRRQLRMLRIFRYRPLRVDDVAAFHSGALPTLPRRSYFLTADDGYVDAAETLRQVPFARPVLFVITKLPSGKEIRSVENARPALPQAPIAEWELLRAAAQAGVEIGAHSRTHPSLPNLNPAQLEDELGGARADIAAAGLGSALVLAYPYGRSSKAVRKAAIDAGYTLAFTTQVGRNGAGTDPWCLHRVGVHARDGIAAFMWKTITGEPAPDIWERWQVRRERRRLARSRGEAPEGASG